MYYESDLELKTYQLRNVLSYAEQNKLVTVKINGELYNLTPNNIKIESGVVIFDMDSIKHKLG